MADNTFTPGPWQLGGCSGRMIVKPGYGDIADVDTLANAKLIVLAPTLFDVLANIVRVLSVNPIGKGRHARAKREDAIQRAWEQACAVITEVHTSRDDK